jgi:N-acetylglutamate synthase-like GNAT family acetyltransferase
MLCWLQRFLANPDKPRRNPCFDLDPVRGRMKAARIRIYHPDDFAACRELYVLNESGRFPPGILPEFEAALQSKSLLFLGAEREGEICGCGGIAIHPGCRAALAFGLIHPQRQGQGLGTILLLARLALLPDDNWLLYLTSVPASRAFYEQFGFREWSGQKLKLKSGEELPSFITFLSPDLRSQCASLLAQAGVELLATTADIP